MITIQSTAIHESGHIVVLATCGCDEISIVEVSMERTARAAGGVKIEFPANKAGRPWRNEQPNRRAELSLALMNYGGMAAETEHFGKRPNRGWSDDVRDTLFRLSCLAGERVSRALVERALYELEIEALDRVRKNRHAVKVLADELLLAHRISGVEAMQIVHDAGWTGVIGPPNILGLL